MQVSIEAFVGINLVINAGLLSVIARSRGGADMRRILFAAAFGTLYALAMQWDVFYLLRFGPSRILLACVMTLAAIPVDSLAGFMTVSALFIASTMFLGELTGFLFDAFGRSNATLVLACAVGFPVLIAGWSARSRRMQRFEARLYLCWRNRQMRLIALIDTGNQLREPVSGCPVLIVEERLIARMIPRHLLRRARTELPSGFRLVAYDTLGGRGTLPCFRPDQIYASYGDGWFKAPDMYVAIYPGVMPVAVGALAPPLIGMLRQESIPSKRRLDKWSIRQVR